MAESPDQFQRHVRVRLPIADRFLGTPQEAAAAALDLEQCFRHPLLSMTIAPRPRGTGARTIRRREDRDPARNTER